MSRVQQAIEVGVPVHAAYQQLTHFENYPQFMTGVTQVTQMSATEASWVLDLDGHTRCDMQLTECYPDQRVTWQSADEPILTEALTLKSVSPGRTQIIAELDADVRALMPGDAHAQDTLSRRLKADLGRFKEYCEAQAGTAGRGQPLNASAASRQAVREPHPNAGPQAAHHGAGGPATGKVTPATMAGAKTANAGRASPGARAAGQRGAGANRQGKQR